MDMLDEAPEWFDNLLARTLKLSRRSHDVLESVLGIGKLLAEGDEGEAWRVSQQLRSQIDALEAHPDLPGELDSTQLVSMFESEFYPKDLRTKIKSALERE